MHVCILVDVSAMTQNPQRLKPQPKRVKRPQRKKLQLKLGSRKEQFQQKGVKKWVTSKWKKKERYLVSNILYVQYRKVFTALHLFHILL